MALMTLQDLEQHYNKAKFSNTSPVSLENMSIYGDNVAPMAVNATAPAGLQTIDIAQVPEAQSVTQSNGLDYLLNQGGDNNYVNRNINYDNLKIPALQSEKRNNFFTDAMGNIKSYADKNKVLSGIMKGYNFIKDPLMAGATSILGMLPDRDPRQGTLENFYGDNFGLTSSGSVASGIMQGYNPVSGGLFGGETQYGLTPAIDKRKVNIYNSLTNLGKYNYTTTMDPLDLSTWKGANKATIDQLEKLRELEKVKEAEAKTLQQVKEKEFNERVAAETATANRARAANAAVYASADAQGFTNAQGGFSTSAADRAGTSAGSGQFSPSSSRGRSGYGTGGIVTL